MAKLSNSESCTTDSQCCCGQYCSFNSKNNALACQCGSDRWWNDAISYCQKGSAYAGACLTADECEPSKNMVCLSNMCTGSDPGAYFWNGTYCGKLI